MQLSDAELADINRRLEKKSSREVIEWALNQNKKLYDKFTCMYFVINV